MDRTEEVQFHATWYVLLGYASVLPTAQLVTWLPRVDRSSVVLHVAIWSVATLALFLGLRACSKVTVSKNGIKPALQPRFSWTDVRGTSRTGMLVTVALADRSSRWLFTSVMDRKDFAKAITDYGNDTSLGV